MAGPGAPGDASATSTSGPPAPQQQHDGCLSPREVERCVDDALASSQPVKQLVAAMHKVTSPPGNGAGHGAAWDWEGAEGRHPAALA